MEHQFKEISKQHEQQIRENKNANCELVKLKVNFKQIFYFFFQFQIFY
jgi:hypothetical protein